MIGKACFSDGASNNFKVCTALFPVPTSQPTSLPTGPTPAPVTVPTVPTVPTVSTVPTPVCNCSGLNIATGEEGGGGAPQNPPKRRRPLLRRNERNQTTLLGLPQAASISILALFAVILLVSSGAALVYGSSLNRFMKLANSEAESLVKESNFANNANVVDAEADMSSGSGKRALVTRHSRQSSRSQAL